MIRGNPANQGEVCSETVFEGSGRRQSTCLSAWERTTGVGRIDYIARQSATARVFVNRLWLHHFGRGLVATPDNFGELGDRPSHPELLDYLAVRFQELGWSIKAMHREIMLSSVYQQSSLLNESNAGIDPDNRYLWRMTRRRLDVESLARCIAGGLRPVGSNSGWTIHKSGRRRQRAKNRLRIHQSS